MKDDTDTGLDLTKKQRAEYREQALQQYGSDDILIENIAKVFSSVDGGVWVAAYVYVRLPFEKELNT